MASFRHKVRLYNSVFFLPAAEYILEENELLPHMYIVLVIEVAIVLSLKVDFFKLKKKKILFQCMVKLNYFSSRD